MTAALRWRAWARWPAAIGLLIVFAVQEGFGDVLRGVPQAGVTMLWLVPFHALPLLLDAAGLGVQEAAIMVLAQLAGVDRQAAIALALVKRMREVLFGCIALAGWQLAEMRRTSPTSRSRLTRG